MKRLICLALALVLIVFAVWPETPEAFTLQLVPTGRMPLGSSSELYSFGTGIGLSLAVRPLLVDSFGLKTGAEFMMLPLKSQDAVHLTSGSAGPVALFPIGSRFEVFAEVQAGYYWWYPSGWDAEGAGGGGLLYGSGLGARFLLNERIALGGEADFCYLDQLYNGLSFSLALSYSFPRKVNGEGFRGKAETRPVPLSANGEGLEIEELSVPTLFPVLYAYYHDHPVGTLILCNYESRRVEDIRLSFFVERYMDNPKELDRIERMEAGDTVMVELYGLFTEELMDVTEGTKASGKITVSYVIGGKEKRREYTPAIEFHNRNALTWSDDRKIAAFVTAKDPEVLTFAKNVSGWIQELQNPAVDENLQKGMALFSALQTYGLHYEVDPATPFAELSVAKTAIDFLQFPRQTLQFTSGDCDDLSALYTALLEALGVETAMITVPGHIYPAIALEMSPEEARQSFSRPGDLVFIEEKAWLPLEITMCRGSFREAWQHGAKQWREYYGLGQAQLYPTHEAWQTYQAVGFREAGVNISLPKRSRVTELFGKELELHVQREIYPQEARLLREMEGGNRRHVWANKLAVLYARNGLYEKALAELQEIVEAREYPPALINSGNIYFMRGEYVRALEFYDRAIKANRDIPTALLGSARCHHELENYGFAERDYGRLKLLAPKTARRFAYLDFRGEEASRAADAAGLRGKVVWEEE